MNVRRSKGLSLLDCLLGSLVLSGLAYLTLSLASQQLKIQGRTLGELQRIDSEQGERESCTQELGFIRCKNSFKEELVYIHESLQPS